MWHWRTFRDRKMPYLKIPILLFFSLLHSFCVFSTLVYIHHTDNVFPIFRNSLIYELEAFEVEIVRAKNQGSTLLPFFLLVKAFCYFFRKLGIKLYLYSSMGLAYFVKVIHRCFSTSEWDVSNVYPPRRWMTSSRRSQQDRSQDPYLHLRMMYFQRWAMHNDRYGFTARRGRQSESNIRAFITYLSGPRKSWKHWKGLKHFSN